MSGWQDRSTQPVGCINTGTECKDFANDYSRNNGCSSYPGGSNPCDCVQTYIDLVAPSDCVPGQSTSGECTDEWSRVKPGDLWTTYRADSPVEQKCKLQSFWSQPARLLVCTSLTHVKQSTPASSHDLRYFSGNGL